MSETTEHTDVVPASEPEPSWARIDVLDDAAVTCWSLPSINTPADGYPQSRLQLGLTPERPAVIGRKQGGTIEYLDPAYQPTQLVPGTGQSVLQDQEADNFVSRGHFMLRASAAGILLVNGVPRRGGGIRPPLNGTWLLGPAERPLRPGESVLIRPGTSITIRLPNGVRLQIGAGV
jgi:hypothetical protein